MRALTGEDLRAAAFTFADGLWHSSAETARRTDHLFYASQYAGRPIVSLTDFDERGTIPTGPAAQVGKSARNLTRTLVDTAMSRVAKSETRVQWLTNGGSDAEQEKSEEATDAANALIEQTEGEVELRRGLLHAMVFDLGIVKTVETPDGPISEHVPSWEVMFDPADAHRGKPSIRVHHFPASIDALIVKFLAPTRDETPEQAAEREEKIRRLRDSHGTALVTADHTQTEQHVISYELWYDPIGRRPGRHVAVTESVLLLDEAIAPGTKRNAPFTFFGFSEPTIGAYPTSIAAIVSELQADIDGMKTRKGQIVRLLAVPRYIATGPDGANVDVQVRGGSDAVGDIIHAPIGTTLTPVNLGLAESLTALTNELNEAWAKGFEMVGINPSNAVGSRPNGLNSAPAQREWNEIAQDRLSMCALAFQRAHVDLAELQLAAVAKIPDYEINVKSPNGRFLKALKVRDLNLQRSTFKLIPYPISALPNTPTGKLAAAGDLLQMGGLDKDDFQEIVQLPDLKSKLNVNLASRRATATLVTKMLTTGQAIAPPACLEPLYALKYVTAKWLDGVADDMDAHSLDMLQSWMDELGKRLEPPPAAPAAPAGAPAPSPGLGAPPPGGDILAPAPVLGGKVGATPVALAPAGIAPLQNHPFAQPVGYGQAGGAA